MVTLIKGYLVKGIDRRDFPTVFILLFNSLTWYYITMLVLHNLSEQYLNVVGVYNTAIVGSSLVGPLLVNKTGKLPFLYFWLIFGTIVSPLLALVEGIPMIYVSSIFFILGISLGLGMPSSLTYFADCTLIENRGRMAGIVFLFTAFAMPLFGLALENQNLSTVTVIFTLWRGLGFVLFFSLKPRKKVVSQEAKHVSYWSILQTRTFYLYLIPWLMFSFIERFGELILRPAFISYFSYSPPPIGPLVGGIFAFIGGLLSDFFGRKRVIIPAFIALGIAYAVIGIAPTFLSSWYFHIVIDGMAWGIFFIIFVMILWGDLSKSGAEEKYYAVGNIPFFFAGVIQLFLAPYASSIPESSVFSLTSFFLFLAVLPLMYASETLPEKKIRLRQLRGYLEKAKKVREKHLKKSARG